MESRLQITKGKNGNTQLKVQSSPDTFGPLTASLMSYLYTDSLRTFPSLFTVMESIENLAMDTIFHVMFTKSPVNISADVPLMLHECWRVYLMCVFIWKMSFVKSLHLQYIAFIHCWMLEWYCRCFTTERVNLLWDVYQIYTDVTLKIESDAFQMMHLLTDILIGHTHI